MHPDAAQFQIGNTCSAKHDPRLFRKMRKVCSLTLHPLGDFCR